MSGRGSTPNPLPKSCDLSEPLIGLGGSAPDPLPKFSKSFDSNSTSNDESDVLTRSQGLMAHLIYISISFTKNDCDRGSTLRRGPVRSQDPPTS